MSFRGEKSKSAPKIQDGGRIFLSRMTKKIDMTLKNSQTKTGACCQSVNGPTVSACTIRKRAPGEIHLATFTENTKFGANTCVEKW